MNKKTSDTNDNKPVPVQKHLNSYSSDFPNGSPANRYVIKGGAHQSGLAAYSSDHPVSVTSYKNQNQTKRNGRTSVNPNKKHGN